MKRVQLHAMWVAAVTGLLAITAAHAQSLPASASAPASRPAAGRLDLLTFKAAADIQRPKGFYPVLAYNADLKFDAAGDQSWLNVTFAPPAPEAKEKFAAVFFEFDYAAAVEPFDSRQAPDGSADWPNVWLGWDALVFDYDNRETTPITATVLIQDWVSWYCPKYDGLVAAEAKPPQSAPATAKSGGALPGLGGNLPQLYEEEVTLKPGRGTVSIDLKRRPLWTNNKKKGLSLDDVRAFGLCLKDPAGKASVNVNNFRLTGSSPSAGVLKPLLERVKCEKCGKSTSDVYAPFCPFCGGEAKGYQPIPAEMPSFASKTVIPATSGGGGKTHGGGGGDATDESQGRSAVFIAHYDAFYDQAKGAGKVDRRGGHWEWRYYLSFQLGDEVKDPSKIKKAELWLFAAKPKEAFNEKPWGPGVLLFEVAPCYAPEDLAKINWMSMPPFERLLYVSGQHPGSATQDPKLKTTPLPAPKWLPMDITEAVREAAGREDKTLLLGLKAFTASGASHEPHSMGHYLTAGGPLTPGDRKPKLVLEMAE